MRGGGGGGLVFLSLCEAVVFEVIPLAHAGCPGFVMNDLLILCQVKSDQWSWSDLTYMYTYGGSNHEIRSLCAFPFVLFYWLFDKLACFLQISTLVEETAKIEAEARQVRHSLTEGEKQKAKLDAAILKMEKQVEFPVFDRSSPCC